MAIFTHTLFNSPPAPIPSEAALAVGIPDFPPLSAHLTNAIEKGWTVATVQLILGTEENNITPFTIVREWYDADQAQIWADLYEQLYTQNSIPEPEKLITDSTRPIQSGFVNCTIVNT